MRIFKLLGDADDLLDASWRERNWATFARVWLTSSVGLLVIAFVTPFVFIFPALLYNVLAWIAGGKRIPISLSDIWNLALPFCILVGVFMLIVTPAVMLLKQVSGDFNRT